MSIAFIQATSTTGAGNLSLPFASNNTASNFILVVAGSTSNAGLSVSDSNGNTYSHFSGFSGGSSSYQVFIAKNIAAGANTVSLTAGGTSVLAIIEFSGVNQLDQFASASGSGTSQSSGNITTTVAAELLLGLTAGTGNITSLSPGTGWTAATTNSSGSTNPLLLTEYQVVNSTGTFAATSTNVNAKGGGFNWTTQILSFKFSLNPSVVKTTVIQFGF